MSIFQKNMQVSQIVESSLYCIIVQSTTLTPNQLLNTSDGVIQAKPLQLGSLQLKLPQKITRLLFILSVIFSP